MSKLSKTPTAIVMSSFVSASRVGATASAFCLRRLGIETHVLPTVLLGRHPGWGAPGGGLVEPAQLSDMWGGIKAQNLPIDAVMTGYMASPAHVELAAQIIKDTKTAHPEALILVDPVMGDHGRLYISEDTASAIASLLIPLADICTPNLWELSHLSGAVVKGAPSALKAAATLPCDVLVTSVPFGGEIGDEIGVIYIERKTSIALAVSHTRFKAVPNGGGDALAGTFLAHVLKGRSRRESLARAVASIFDIISHAVDTDAGEMPLIREQDALHTASPLTVKDIS